ncbi:immunoglobulin superfamily member 2 isoform X2 [Ahaetulla prasina]|uniref:immunoglobulin superfamily member 2 isoform X1 n=1 Tax=Ahaetulla prasina TaxID=499056 RepID=UPI0026485549|nr:immunoglobulin superfamily member 2 isoform X1 [Ahaetulla prasina]XP_058041840.1 immunoglobulin superfamily member 2 isoform X2 [Ahaetulla prasina]
MGHLLYLSAMVLVLFDPCVGGRMVSIQKGPLYRVIGTHITISCNVSGYQKSVEQNFEWIAYQSSAPQTQMNIISTKDRRFSYDYYSTRIESREIYIEKTKEDSVLLHITDLKDTDDGVYECHTPNTEDVYLGTYSAKTNISVIPNNLSVTMKSQILMQNEGDSLDLICQVSTATAQHTHISVAWYVIPEGKDRKAQNILSLSKDYILLPGPSYTERFNTGDIRLVKIGDTEYKFSIIKLKHSDQGKLYCEAVEWIQDPDGTWKDIVQKQTDTAPLTIKPLDKKLSMNNPAVKNSTLNGKETHLYCSVESQNIHGSVWLGSVMMGWWLVLIITGPCLSE